MSTMPHDLDQTIVLIYEDLDPKPVPSSLNTLITGMPSISGLLFIPDYKFNYENNNHVLITMLNMYTYALFNCKHKN